MDIPFSFDNVPLIMFIPGKKERKNMMFFPRGGKRKVFEMWFQFITLKKTLSAPVIMGNRETIRQARKTARFISAFKNAHLYERSIAIAQIRGAGKRFGKVASGS